MSFAPEDPRRHKEEDFAKLLIKAHARVFELAHEHSAELRALMLEVEDAKYPDNEAEAADRTQISAMQIPQTGEMSVKIVIGVHGKHSALGMKQLIRLDHGGVDAQLRSQVVRTIFKHLEEDYRRILATYIAEAGLQQATEELSDDYERQVIMKQLIEELRERMISANLPAPPPSIQFQPEEWSPGRLGGGI